MATADELGDDFADDERWQGVRAAVKAARELDEEPPPRIDALLMAAARQHAPAPRPGVLERLRRWLAVAMLQPAVAGATALAVIGGTAGVLYLRGHGDVAQPTVARETAARPQHAAVPAEANPGSATLSGFPDDPAGTAAASGEDVATRLKGLGEQAGDGATAPDPRTGGGGGRDAVRGGRGGGGEAGATPELAEPRDPTGGELRPREVKPAELPRPTLDIATDDDRGAVVGGVVTEMPLTTADRPPPPDTVAQETTSGAADEETAGGGGTAPTADKVTTTAAKGDGQATVSNRRQAENLLLQARTAARAKNCAAVKVMAKRAKQLDAAYYRATFATDAAVKPCL